jgi:hypothetical protein
MTLTGVPGLPSWFWRIYGSQCESATVFHRHESLAPALIIGAVRCSATDLRGDCRSGLRRWERGGDNRPRRRLGSGERDLVLEGARGGDSRPDLRTD